MKQEPEVVEVKSEVTETETSVVTVDKMESNNITTSTPVSAVKSRKSIKPVATGSRQSLRLMEKIKLESAEVKVERIDDLLKKGGAGVTSKLYTCCCAVGYLLIASVFTFLTFHMNEICSRVSLITIEFVKDFF